MSFSFGAPQTTASATGFSFGAPNTTFGGQPQAQQPAPAFGFDNSAAKLPGTSLTATAPAPAAATTAPVLNFGLGSATTR